MPDEKPEPIPGKWYVVTPASPPNSRGSISPPFGSEQEALIWRDKHLSKDFGGTVWQCPEKEADDEDE